MDYAAEATQLFGIVVVLVVAYFGVMVWTRRQNSGHGGAGGGGLFGGGGGMLGGGAAGAPGEDAAGGIEPEVDIPSSKGSDRHKGRFQLQGRDAETAAKVLKRMLKQDPRFREQGDRE